MNRKHLFLFAFIILAVFLSGCNGVITPATDEAKVKSAVHEYFLAINDQNWSKAKGYCVYGSDRYYATCTIEDLFNNMCQLYNVVTITCYADIYNVVIIGNYADAYFNLTFVLTADYYSYDDSGSVCYYLQKIGNSWKIYGP